MGQINIVYLHCKYLFSYTSTQAEDRQLIIHRTNGNVIKAAPARINIINRLIKYNIYGTNKFIQHIFDKMP